MNGKFNLAFSNAVVQLRYHVRYTLVQIWYHSGRTILVVWLIKRIFTAMKDPNSTSFRMFAQNSMNNIKFVSYNLANHKYFNFFQLQIKTGNFQRRRANLGLQSDMSESDWWYFVAIADRNTSNNHHATVCLLFIAVATSIPLLLSMRNLGDNILRNK